MTADGTPPHCPHCGVVMRAIPRGWECPHCGHVALSEDVPEPPETEDDDTESR